MQAESNLLTQDWQGVRFAEAFPFGWPRASNSEGAQNLAQMSAAERQMAFSNISENAMLVDSPLHHPS